MLTLTSPVRTPLHHIRAGWKLAALALVSALLMAETGALSVAVAVAAVAVLCLYLTGGRAFLVQGLRVLRPLWPFILAVLVFGWWDGRTGDAIMIVARMLVLVAMANLVTMTTPLSELLELFEWLARPFARIVPPRRIALALALVIRFIPVMAETLTRLREAARARSARRPGWRVVVPALLAALDIADHSADALRARGGSDGTGARGR